MRKLVNKVRRWLVVERRGPREPVPFETACACGQVARGLRQARHQVLRCSGCGQAVFVLPYSPLPAPGGERRPRATGRDGRTGLGWIAPAWRLPLIGAAVTLAVVVVAFVVLLQLLDGSRPPQATAPETTDLQTRFRDGRRALAAGNFRVAAKEFAAARSLRERQPQALGAADARQLHQLLRQADLLADLLPKSLEEILKDAAGLRDEEWQAQFERRYRGQSVVFDAEVQRLGPEEHRLDYMLQAGVERARIDLNGLRLLRPLPLEQPRRVIFGARLERVAREAGGVWVVRFGPDSGVLLTDEAAATACMPQAPEEDFLEAIRLQAGWLADLP